MARRHTRHPLAAILGGCVAAAIFLACFGSLPWTMSRGGGQPAPRYRAENLAAHRLPPSWASHNADERARRDSAAASPSANAPAFALGSDPLGRDLLTRCLAGGAVSLGVGFAAAAIAVIIGAAYGATAAYAGGRIDAVMMRIVDTLYGLPYILLVILLALAADALADRSLRSAVGAAAQQREAYIEARGIPASAPDRDDAIARAAADAARLYPMPTDGARTAVNIATMLVAIGGVSWLTMARVVRGQVLSLKARPFVEAARSIGANPMRIFFRHLLPNLAGPIVVYATLTVPQAILQESFLSFLGIGIAPPTPSWGTLVADGLSQLNPVRSRWWLLLFPSLFLAVTLLALNMLGEALRESLDPRRDRPRTP